MNTIRTLRKNGKALSPVVASIILIAVTVAVSVAVAAWMGGMTVGLMGGTEKVSITNMEFVKDSVNGDSIITTVQNTGDGSVTIKSGFIDGTAVTISGTTTLLKGNSSAITLPCAVALNEGQLYQVKLATEKGNTIVYTTTYNAAP
jgi:flagellin-like protein